MSRQCCFCTSTKLTREHLWGEWIGELLGPRAYTITRLENGKRTIFPKYELNLKARFACGPCNSGWMSNVEGKTKQIISDMILKGTPRVLEVRDLAVLAALVFIKSVVANSMDGKIPFLSFGERRTFARTLQVPRGVQMWFGRFPHSMGGVWKSSYIETPGNTARDFKGKLSQF